MSQMRTKPPFARAVTANTASHCTCGKDCAAPPRNSRKRSSSTTRKRISKSFFRCRMAGRVRSRLSGHFANHRELAQTAQRRPRTPSSIPLHSFPRPAVRLSRSIFERRRAARRTTPPSQSHISHLFFTFAILAPYSIASTMAALCPAEQQMETIDGRNLHSRKKPNNGPA